MSLYLPQEIIKQDNYKQSIISFFESYLNYLRNEVEFINKLIKNNECEIINELNLEKILDEIENTKATIKEQKEIAKNENILKILDKIETYLLKYELALSMLWSCNENN